MNKPISCKFFCNFFFLYVNRCRCLQQECLKPLISIGYRLRIFNFVVKNFGENVEYPSKNAGLEIFLLTRY